MSATGLPVAFSLLALRLFAIANLPDKGRRLAVDQPVANIARFVDNRVMRGHRARVAPVPVERLTRPVSDAPRALNSSVAARAPTRWQPPAPAPLRLPPADCAVQSALHRRWHERHRPAVKTPPPAAPPRGSPTPAADLPHHLQDLRILTRDRGVAMAVHAGAFFTPRRHRVPPPADPASVASKIC